MRRTERLFQIIQILRRARRPVTGQHLAEELEVSLRTLYRDMAELIAQRVPIRGEAGTGYVLDRGYDLPPLMLTADELEAAVLGAKWVAARGDDALARGAEDLIAKLSSVVPPELEPVIVDAGVFPVTKYGNRIKDSFDVSLARSAIRHQQKMYIDYTDEHGSVSGRTIWPFMIAYWEEVRLICAWCELRQDFRHFRTDRVLTADLLEDRFRERVQVLRARWTRAREADRKRASLPE